MIVCSEIKSLNKVLVHEPDHGIEYISPEIAEELLYDDIVFLPRMIEEHSIFTQSLKQLIGKENVLEFSDLLHQILKIESVKNELLLFIYEYENLSLGKFERLKQLEPQDLGTVLISGALSETHEVLLAPLPNLVFTRDLGVVIKDHILLCKANKKARVRENILMKYIACHHPVFSSFKNKMIDFVTKDNLLPDSDISIEGGDVMLINDNHLLIGESERTSLSAIFELKEIVFEKNLVDFVTIVEIPNERYCMHLDTLFTLLDATTCVGYAPLLFEKNDKVDIVTYSKDNQRAKLHATLKDLIQEIYPNMKFVACGNGVAPFAQREQWTDGCNFVAVKEGLVYSYERNVRTLQALKNVGYSTISAKRILHEEITVSDIDNSIITIASAELSRARGGPHCMTFPIGRL